jgi:preprotein translocase subunit SecG
MKFVAVLFVLVSVVLILVILVQKGRGGGLSGAFGGGMASGLLGSKTGDFLTWVTIVLVVIFLTLAVLMGRFFKPEIGEFGTEPSVESSQPTAGEQAQPSGTQAPTTEADLPAEPSGDANSAGG